jgi:hypothetical protein
VRAAEEADVVEAILLATHMPIRFADGCDLTSVAWFLFEKVENGKESG